MLQAGYVVGADGKHSTVRRAARFDAQVTPFASRQLIARAPRPDGWPQRIRSHRAERPVVVIPTQPDYVHVFGDVTVPDTAPAADALADLAASASACYPRLGALVAGRGECVAVIRHHAVQVARWRSGRVVLLGDSAHSVHPYGGQGINLALQDAVLLAGALDEDLRAGGNAAADDFESRRRPFVERFQARQRHLLDPGTASTSLYAGNFSAPGPGPGGAAAPAAAGTAQRPAAPRRGRGRNGRIIMTAATAPGEFLIDGLSLRTADVVSVALGQAGPVRLAGQAHARVSRSRELKNSRSSSRAAHLRGDHRLR